MDQLDIFGLEEQPKEISKPQLGKVFVVVTSRESPNISQNRLEKSGEIEDLKEKVDKACIEYLTNKATLWDMRCWHKYKDREEIIAKIRAIELVHDIRGILNDGHAAFQIRNYLYRHNDKEAMEVLIKCFMDNNNVSFKNRLIPCWLDISLCEVYKEKKNYSDCKCGERCNGK